MSRRREKRNDGPTGIYHNGYTNQSRILTLSSSVIVDEVMPGNGHNLNIFHYDASKRPRYDAKWKIDGRDRYYADVPISNWYSDGRRPQPVYSSPVPPLPALIAKLLADTNPSRPYVDVTVFAAELRELPDLILKRTSDIGRDIASGRLSAEFGWKPLIGDIRKLLDWSAALDKRTVEIQHLMESGLRRKRTLHNDSWSWDREEQMRHNDQFFHAYCSEALSSSRKVWGFVRWMYNPSTVLPLSLPGDARTKAIQATFGLTVDPATIWELLPFSWLADWCSNVGDVLLASRNTVGAVPSRVQIMTQEKITNQVTVRALLNGPGSISKVSGESPWNQTFETKTRQSGSLSIAAQMPFLSVRQASILADVVTGFTRNDKYRRGRKLPKYNILGQRV